MRSIEVVRMDLAGYAAGFDPDACSAADARAVFAAADAIERIAAAIKARAAARIAASSGWEATGERSPAHLLARQTGTTVGAARSMLETGQVMRAVPQLAAAACAGELSPTQAAAVASVGAVAPDLVSASVDRAKETTVAELRGECARTLASRDPDPRARQQRIHRDRGLRRWVEASGAHVAQMRGTAEMIAGVFTDIAPAREQLFRQARERGEDVTPEALDADALVATVRAGRDGTAGVVNGAAGAPKHRCAPRAKMLVRVDLDALLRGYPIDGEVCEIAGYGPMSVDAARDMAASGDAFLAAIVAKGQQVVGVAHLGRKALATQQTALEWLNPVCAADGCTQHARLEIDHRQMWSRTKVILVELLDRLCDHHHDLKTFNGWSLVDGNGRRPFLPPSDPRHPAVRGDPTTAA